MDDGLRTIGTMLMRRELNNICTERIKNKLVSLGCVSNTERIIVPEEEIR
jgi:hypothetical protein